MIKILFLQQLYRLSDPALEDALIDRLSFQRFVGLSFSEEIPHFPPIWYSGEQEIYSGILEKGYRHRPLFERQKNGRTKEEPHPKASETGVYLSAIFQKIAQVECKSKRMLFQSFWLKTEKALNFGPEATWIYFANGKEHFINWKNKSFEVKALKQAVFFSDSAKSVSDSLLFLLKKYKSVFNGGRALWGMAAVKIYVHTDSEKTQKGKSGALFGYMIYFPEFLRCFEEHENWKNENKNK
ncbi:MAG TPA: transposase, partial [bacterium]|nr:transposase [bacterium]